MMMPKTDMGYIMLKMLEINVHDIDGVVDDLMLMMLMEELLMLMMMEATSRLSTFPAERRSTPPSVTTLRKH